MSSTFRVKSVTDDRSTTPSVDDTQRRTQHRSTSMSAATVVRFLWIQTLTRALIGGLTTTEAASSDGSPASSSLSCPPACFCNAPSRIVYCSRRGLTAVPDGIAANSLQLNLNGNVFASSTLRRGNFSDLPSLEHLYLSECGIERLGVRYCVLSKSLRFSAFSCLPVFLFSSDFISLIFCLALCSRLSCLLVFDRALPLRYRVIVIFCRLSLYHSRLKVTHRTRATFLVQCLRGTASRNRFTAALITHPTPPKL